MRARSWMIGAVIGMVMALTACQQAVAPTSPTPPASRSPLTSLASPPRASPATAAPPRLVVANVGAAASPSGFIALAVIDNPSSQTATDVTVEMVALNAAGQMITRREGRVPRIGPQSREAVALAFPVGQSLPAQFTGRVTGVHWSAAATGDLVQVASANFTQDARTPSVTIHVVNRGPAAAPIEVIAVCWDDAGTIRGGGSRSVMVGPDAQGHDVTVEVAIATPPARCDGYGVSTG